MLDIINELVVDDVEKSIKFYEDYFGFEVKDVDGDPISWVRLEKDNCVIMLESYMAVVEEIKDYPIKTKSHNLIKFKYSEKEEIYRLYDLLKNNALIFMELKTTEYGSIEFGVYDPDSNIIIVSYS